MRSAASQRSCCRTGSLPRATGLIARNPRTIQYTTLRARRTRSPWRVGHQFRTAGGVADAADLEDAFERGGPPDAYL